MAEFFFPLIPDGDFDHVTLTATTQEISVDNYCTHITGTGSAACVATLPAGTKVGQLKKIVTRSAASATSIQVTLTNHTSDDTDIVDLNANGRYVICQWQTGVTDASSDEGKAWRVLETGKIDAGSDHIS